MSSMATQEKNAKMQKQDSTNIGKKSKQEYVFRKATVHDTRAVKDLIDMFHEEYLKGLGFSMSDLLFKKIAASNVLNTTWIAKLADTVIPASKNEDGTVNGEDTRIGKVVGVFSGYYTTYILNNEKLFHELVWYVHPDHRKGCGMKLYKHCENHVKISGAKKMVMIHMATDKSEKLTKLYEQMGFKPLETHYIKEL